MNYRALSYLELKELSHNPTKDDEAFRERLIRDYQQELDYAEEDGQDESYWRAGLKGLLAGEPTKKWNY